MTELCMSPTCSLVIEPDMKPLLANSLPILLKKLTDSLVVEIYGHVLFVSHYLLRSQKRAHF